MKRVLVALIVLAVLVGGLIYGPQATDYDGYILLVFEQGTVQLSLFGAILSALVLVLLVWFVVKLFQLLWHVVFNTSNWIMHFSERKRVSALHNGLADLITGHPDFAYAQLTKVKSADFDGVNQLAYAEAARRLAKHDTAEEYYIRASEHKHLKTASLASLYKLYLSRNQAERVLEEITALEKSSQQDKRIIEVWAEALVQTNRWDTLSDKLPGWKKQLGQDHKLWQMRLAQGQFAEIASKQGANELKSNWQSLPRAKRKDPQQQAVYIQQLIDQGMHVDAQDALLKLAGNEPNLIFLPLFSQLKLPNPAPSIKQLEEWIKKDSTNAALYSTLGQLAYHSQDLVLAEKAISKAISLQETNQDLLLLAKIKEAKKENTQALELYKKSAQTHD